MATGEDKCELLKLSHDEVSIVTHELCDPLEPLLAVHLSSTAKGLRVASTLAAFLCAPLTSERFERRVRSRQVRPTTSGFAR